MTKLLLSLPLFLLLASCEESKTIYPNQGEPSSSAESSTPAGNSNSSSEDSSTPAGPSASEENASVVAVSESVSFTTYTYSSEQSVGNVRIAISKVPDAGLYTGVSIEQEDTSVASVNFNQSSSTNGVFNIQFASGASLGEGTHLNKVALAICYDEQCSKHVEGSPVVIDTTLNALAGTASVSTSESVISVKGNSAEGSTPEQSVIPIAVSGISPSDVFVEITEQEDEMNISDATHQLVGGKLDLLVDFTGAQSLSSGVHTSSYSANICYDNACDYPLEGSPLAFTINYEVSSIPSGSGIARPDARTELDHDVVDAEYSAQLNAVAIASSAPRNAVYVYDLDDLTNVQEIPLGLVPTAISFANAGESNKIAVGHDAKVTFINFNESDPASTSTKLLNVAIDVYDLTATDSAVYAVPRVDQWEELHRIDVDDNSITNSGYPSIRAASKVKLHPEFKSVYLANRGLSPSDIEKIDIQTVPPAYLTDSPYNGDYAMCGDLWMGNSGDRIYTACGNTFKASEVESQDMIYTGKLPLLTSDDFSNSDYRVSSVSESSSKNEIAVIEKDNSYGCDINSSESCNPHVLSFFSKDFLTRMSASSFSRLSLAAGTAYGEKPSFVFYNDVGTSAFVISELISSPSQKSYILTFNR